jgi:hypothetical protein
MVVVGIRGRAMKVDDYDASEIWSCENNVEEYRVAARKLFVPAAF